MQIDVDKIKELVISGDLDPALTMLCEGTRSTEFEVDSIVIASKYNKWKNEKQKGILDDRQEQLSYNKVVIGVVELLNEIIVDYLHNQLKYNNVRFFETSRESIVNQKDRVYSYKFNQDATRHVGWELLMSSPRLKVDLNHLIKWTIEMPNGKYTPKFSTEFHFMKGWSNPWVAASWGKREYGKLDKGNYMIRFYIKGKEVFSGNFLIE